MIPDYSEGKELSLASLINLGSLQIMADSHYKATGMPIGIIDAHDDSILVGAGWQDICIKFHRVNSQTQLRCQESDRSIKEHLQSRSPYQYKCKNGLWDIGMPIIVFGQHLATLFLGQFFYDDEIPDRQFFFTQAKEFGFNEKEYLSSLGRVPVFRHEKVDSILEYDMALIDFITDLAQNSLLQEEERKERMNLESQLRQAQKIESIGRLAGGIAHDYNNMLGVIVGYSEMIMEDVQTDRSIYNAAKQIHDVSMRSLNLNNKLLAFARKQTISPKVIDLNDAIKSIIVILERLIGDGIDLVWTSKKELWHIKVDQNQIDQVMTNLCINARDAINGIGKITIETDNVVLDESYCRDHTGFVPGEYVSLSVHDNGSGMSLETQANLFEPFFTTKEVGKGTGLGLSMVYGAVKQNDGFINVDSTLGRGAQFTIYFPRNHSKVVPEVDRERHRSTDLGQETILLVEDEPSLLQLIAIRLKKLGYHVIEASSPGKALHQMTEYTGTIHMLMTDVIMPGMSGSDLAKSIMPFQPYMKVLFMSGYTSDIISHNGVIDQDLNFIQKPFGMNTLGKKIRDVLDNP